MYAAKKTPEEQYQLVLECRRSGLTDCEWCRKNGINPNTFYTWISRLRKKACYAIPESSISSVPNSRNKFNKALTYARNRQDILMTYLEDGRCSLSNNMSENSIRPVVVGRKNWLFSDTMDGAEASMGIYTIVEMAKLHGLEPYKYMKYILERRPTYQFSDEELEKLAPWSDSVQEICR